FCAGADLKERRTMTLDDTRQYLIDLRAMIEAVAGAPRPTIAAIDGGALGGGLELALACDLRVATERAQLGLTEVRVGIMPGAGGSEGLAGLIGVGAAKELILLGRRVGAARACELGLVSRVVAAGALDGAVAELMAELEGCAPIAVVQAKQAIERGFDVPLRE